MKNYFLIMLTFGILLSYGCEKNDPFIPNEEELITTLKYILTSELTGQEFVFSFQDLDGDGGFGANHYYSETKI